MAKHRVSDAAAWLLLGLTACAGPEPSSPEGAPADVAPAAADDRAPRAASSGHRGPAVAVTDDGPARVTRAFLDAFDTEAAMESVVFMDRYYRAPGNEGYDLSLEHLADRLRDAGFGMDPRLEMRFLEQPMHIPAWTPRSGSLVLSVDGERETLHAFTESSSPDRVMLPVNAVEADVEGRVALALESVRPGDILVTDSPTEQVLRRARHYAASAVVSASLAPFNIDPTGKKRHLDAIQYVVDQQNVRGEGVEFRRAIRGTAMPTAQISLRSLNRIREAVASGAEVRLALAARVDFQTRPLRTLIAAVVGATRPDEAVAMASHVQEPGACDNASGAAGLGESAVALAGLLLQGDVGWPARTIVFIWGDEFRQTRAWLEFTERHPVAGFSSDMTGESRERTGAIALLERNPDPGALLTLPPDEHTAWGAGKATDADLNPNALAVIARCAMVDVARHSGGWVSADHPWEGGSDHDEFIHDGIPAVLFWHFTDFAYHTSLDRLDMVDPEEMRRTQVALLASAYAIADPRHEDNERYRASIALEQQERVTAAERAGRNDIAAAWRDWCAGAERWLDREMRP
jgi:hypothetical protein